MNNIEIEENFSDGKKPVRKGLANRMGVDCKKSVGELRKIAKRSSGEKQRMAHWCANMKSGRQKSNECSRLTEDVNSMSEEEQLAEVQQDGYTIRYINTPSLQVQLAAVQQDGWAILYINTPSLQVQSAAVQENGWAIQFINTPDPALFVDEQVKRSVLTALLKGLKAGRDISDLILYLRTHQVNWPELDKIEAVLERGKLTESRDYNSMSEEEQLAAVQQNGWAIQFIKTPDPALFVDEQVKRSVLKALLTGLKAGRDISDLISYLREHQVNWPELDKIEAVINRSKIE